MTSAQIDNSLIYTSHVDCIQSIINNSYSVVIILNRTLLQLLLYYCIKNIERIASIVF